MCGDFSSAYGIHSFRTAWRSATSTPSSLASNSTPICPQEIVGSGTPMLEGIKNAATNLAHASNAAFACISVTTDVRKRSRKFSETGITCMRSVRSPPRRGRLPDLRGQSLTRARRRRERKEKWQLRSLSFTWPKLWHLDGSSGSSGTFLFLRVAAQGAPPPGLPHGE